MITPTQMRAARAMLNLSQGEVAKSIGIAANTLSNIESGTSDAPASRLKEIQDFYERQDIAFLQNDGVTRKSGGVDVYKGKSGFLNFIVDVYETMKSGGDIFVSNVNEDDFLKWEGDEAQAHMARMSSITNLRFCILVEEGDTNIVASSYASYRSVSKEYFGDVPLYIYGDKTALIVFKDNVEVFVIRHPEITSFFKSRFLEMWNKAQEVIV